SPIRYARLWRALLKLIVSCWARQRRAYRWPEACVPNLLAFPANAVFGVFQDDATAREFVANLIRAAEVTTMTRFLPFINQLLNFIVEHFRFRLSEYAQDTIKALNRIEYFSLIVFTHGPARQGRRRFASKIVEGRQRDRRVQIVVQARLEFLECFFGKGRQF